MDEQIPEDISPEEYDRLMQEYLGYPKGEEKQGVFQFFNKVMDTKDTSKVGNLGDNELAAVRIYQNLASYAEAMELPMVAEYLLEKAEIILATSDSKTGFLLRQVQTQRREVKSKAEAAQKKRWFTKQKEGEES